jgi:ankyrin repeat protein
MHFAISYRLIDALKYLLDKGADANVLNSRNQTPLFTAIDEKNADGITCIKILLNHPTCDVWKNIDNTTAFDRLLSQYFYHRVDYHKERDEILDLFLQRGLDINKVYDDGNTMLTRAIENNYWMTQWVLKNGGNPDYVKPNGEYPLYMTSDRHGHQETAILLKYNADVTLTSKQFEDMTPLMRALETRDYHLIKLCLEAGYSFYKIHDWLERNKTIRDELWTKSLLRPFLHYIENKPYAPMSLRGLARIKVLKNMDHEEKVKTLGLPILMENFLIWEKYLEMRDQFFENYKMPDTD